MSALILVRDGERIFTSFSARSVKSGGFPKEFCVCSTGSSEELKGEESLLIFLLGF